jgi:hypothetical protein
MVGGAPEFDWGYRSEPGAVGHPVDLPRGKVLGGSSAINGAVAVRPPAQDFRRWGLPGWGYDDLLPDFQRLESRSDRERNRPAGATAPMGLDGDPKAVLDLHGRVRNTEGRSTRPSAGSSPTCRSFLPAWST